MENFLKDFQIPLGVVDGKLLASLAFDKRIPSIEELVECLVNIDEILKIVKIPKLLFKGPNGKIKAIIKIQATWRMFKLKKQFE